MASKSDLLSDSFGTDDTDGWLGGILAGEDDFDRHTLWRLGLWGFAAVGALTLGLLSSQLPVNAQRTQLAATDFAGRAKLIEQALQENQLEGRRLSAAIATLNDDRDRLFSRLSSLEQGLDVVTGSIRKADEKPVAAAAAWPDGTTAPIIESAPATIAASSPAMAAAPPVEPAPAPLVVAAREEPQAVDNPPPAPASAIQAIPIPDAHAAAVDANAKAVEETAVAIADFGLDLGSANSINGLRALWRGLAKQHKAQFDGLRPLIAVRERRNGSGLQLRLIAGPIKDAAAAARICAVLTGAQRDCKTTAFDGQRLSLAVEADKPAPPRPRKPRQSMQLQQPEPARAAGSSTFATMLGIR